MPHVWQVWDGFPPLKWWRRTTICLITHRDSFFPLQPEVELARRVDSQSKLSLIVPGHSSNCWDGIISFIESWSTAASWSHSTWGVDCSRPPFYHLPTYAGTLLTWYHHKVIRPVPVQEWKHKWCPSYSNSPRKVKFNKNQYNNEGY